MKLFLHARSCAALLLIVCLLATAMPVSARSKKGEKDYKQGLIYEAAQQWERAAQEFALAVAADPAQTEYQLHYRRAVFNASQSFMQKGRSLAEQRDYVGAYNSFRQAYGYDPVNQLALSEMERMLRLQREKEGMDAPGTSAPATTGNGTPRMSSSNNQRTNGGMAGASVTRVSQQTTAPVLPPARVEQQRVITFSGDLLNFIRSLAERLDLNVVFDKDLESQRRNININLRDVTTSQALDYIFLVQNLFFQKLSRRTIIVADQIKRAQYQQLVIRTFYLENAKPEDVQRVIQQALPAQNGRPPTASIVNASTNSLTVRDTPENVRLIGELIRNIDKDRSEVVMDVAIYEVSHTDLIQFGNQIGDPSGSSINLGGTQNGFVLAGSRRPSLTQTVAAAAGAAATTTTVASPLALGAALILPSTSFNAFQSKQNTRLVYSNQIHAFDGEQSRARIGQRVPVVTAQTYPFGSNVNTNQTGNTGNGINFGSGGFPVVQYEETGLTIELTPQVFPNLDVQVKMNIVSKDVLNQSNTPTFTERTINGTARIQNNRTMMLVSVAQNKQSNGRAGLPILGGLPLLGYLFTAPRRDNVQSDIVITVTPRVLRSPAIEPRDEEMRPSGTFSTPTTESLEAVLQEADREDQLAAAQRAAQQPQASVLASNNNTQTNNTQPSGNAQQTVNASATTTAATTSVGQPTVAVTAAAAQESVGQLSDSVPPAYVPAPKILMSSNADTSASAGSVGNRTEAVLRSTPSPANVVSANVTILQPKAASENTRNFVVEQVPNRSNSSSAPTSAAELRLIPERQEMRVGDKRRLMLMLKTDAPLGLAVVTFRFDPHSIAVRNVLPVSLTTSSGTAAPTLAQSIDAANGVLLVSLTPPAGTSSLTSAGVLLTLDIEAIGAGESAVTFDTNNTHIVATDGRDVLLQLARSRITVKP